MPRLVLDLVQRRVSSTARRTIAPTRLASGIHERRSDRNCAGKEILVSSIVKMALGRDVPRLGSAHLQQAGQLSGGGHLGRRVHRDGSDQKIHQRPGHVCTGGLLKALSILECH